MAMYYDRQGEEIMMEEYARLHSSGIDYVRVAYDIIEDEIGNTEVSTVWLGINHAYGGGPPLIFETMVFSEDESIDNITRRYSTEEEAREGHETIMLELATNKLGD